MKGTLVDFVGLPSDFETNSSLNDSELAATNHPATGYEDLFWVIFF